jgi:hypothetical protein
VFYRIALGRSVSVSGSTEGETGSEAGWGSAAAESS